MQCAALLTLVLLLGCRGAPGAGDDTDLYWSITSDNLTPTAWSGQGVLSNVGSTVGPTAVVY